MFAPLLGRRYRERVTALSLSLLVHAIFLGWLLHSPAPTFLTPSFLVRGENSKYIAICICPAKIPIWSDMFLTSHHSRAGFKWTGNIVHGIESNVFRYRSAC